MLRKEQALQVREEHSILLGLEVPKSIPSELFVIVVIT